ncbi:MAG: DUF4391 domain-containing protein [Acidobacteria bacterium]|nr:DUF4391 domain-containing protein [Acidobacteriota bacterium]
MLVSYPTKAYVGKVLPKSKIYENARVSTSLKRKFVEQVERITWAYKLSPETTNLPSSASVPEIEVFHIDLKGADISREVIQCIDKAIPFPIIYELATKDRRRVMAAFKRPSEGDSSKWVTDAYFGSAWFRSDTERVPLFPSIDLRRLYEQLLSRLMPVERRAGEVFEDTLARAAEYWHLEREAAKLEIRMQKEKQFNRKVELNAQLRKVRQRITELSH